ncbi:MAG: pilus assembly protein PilM [Acidobacteria bacterium]|nr:pilus assembly protein PilM [Acidobacteriota bacterium]
MPRFEEGEGFINLVDQILNIHVQDVLVLISPDVFDGNADKKKIETIYLSGGLSRLNGLTGIVEQKFQVQTELFNPFRRISYNENKFDSIYFDEMAPLFGVVTGLAIRTADKF